MYDIEAAIDRQLQGHRRNRPTVILTEMDPRLAEAVGYLTRFARIVFLAPREEVEELFDDVQMEPARRNYTLSESAFLDLEQPSALRDELDALLHQIDPGAGSIRDPRWFGITAVYAGYADLVVGGIASDPRNYFRPMLRILADGTVQSEAGIFVLPDASEFPHGVAVFGDVGVNATLTPETLAEIAVDTCCTARSLLPEELFPSIRGAVVSYSNKGSDVGPSPVLVRSACALIPDLLKARGPAFQTVHIEGELKVSAALSARSAAYYAHPRSKHMTDEECATQVHAIIAPNLELGNFLYHLYATRFPDSPKFAVVHGVGCKAVDLAQDSTVQDAILSIKVGLLRLLNTGWKKTPRDAFFPRPRILVINPGSTSSKIGVFEGDHEVFTAEIKHSAEELKPFAGKPSTAQYAFRKDVIARVLQERGEDLSKFDAISARGGLLYPLPQHGTYLINAQMVADLQRHVQGDHATNLGALIAYELAQGKPAFIVDPGVIDEVPSRSKITGIKGVRRKVISHALNAIATAHRYARTVGSFYEHLNLIICHMGGGISIGAHKHGHYIDANDALNGEGPFSPERSGSLPVCSLIDLCFSGQYTKEELMKLNKGRGGLLSLLGTSDFIEIEDRYLNREPEVVEVVEAMSYQIAKSICALVPAFDGDKVDRILLTGGLARSKILVDQIKRYVRTVAGVSVFPGEHEMAALAEGALRVLNGREPAQKYDPKDW